MSTRQLRFAISARRMPHSFALACATLILMTSSTQAATVLQFSQANSGPPTPDVATAMTSGSSTTLSNGIMPVVVTNFNGTPEPPGFVLFETFVGVTSTGAATLSGTTISQTYSGTIEFTSGPRGTGTDFLTAKFTNAVFSGSGNSVSLNATAPNLTFTSDLATFPTNTGLSIGFTLIGGAPLSISGSGSTATIAGFTATNAGSLGAAAAVPEPSAFCLASLATVIVGTLAGYRRKRVKI